tara:strand:+ start:2810 stop:3010 length:201 start_codon:yes stop_codon:yes gene_type:complete
MSDNVVAVTGRLIVTGSLVGGAAGLGIAGPIGAVIGGVVGVAGAVGLMAILVGGVAVTEVADKLKK